MRQEHKCGQKIVFGRREQWVHPYAWVFIFISSCHYINIEAISAATMRSLIPNHLLPSCYTGHMNRDFCYSCWPRHQVELRSELDCWLRAASCKQPSNTLGFNAWVTAGRGPFRLQQMFLKSCRWLWYWFIISAKEPNSVFLLWFVCLFVCYQNYAKPT